MKIKYLILSSISGFLISLDQLTKMFIHTRFALGESVPVIEGYFNITYVRNPGAAFGFLARAPEGFRESFFLIIPILAVIVIINLLRQVRDDDKVQIIALSLIFGGAIGNYIDRIRFQYVIDFLEFHYQHRISWPAFNVADSSIVVGVSLLFLIMMTEKRRKAVKGDSPKASSGGSALSSNAKSTTKSTAGSTASSATTPAAKSTSFSSKV